MSLPTSEPLNPRDQGLPPARRRHQRRMILPGEESDRSAFLSDLAQRITPSADFFIFTILAALVAGVAIMLDVPALYILAALLAPFMAPAIGLGFATILGSGRFFLQSFGGLSIGCMLVFGGGALSGWLSKVWTTPLTYQQATFHTVFSWPDIALLTLGAGLTTFLLVRSPNQRPLVTSVAVAYELYLPAAVAGYGLTSGAIGMFPDGLVVLIVHIAWTALVGTIVLAILGLKPLNFFGYTLATTVALVCVAAIVTISGLGTAAVTNVALPQVTPSLDMALVVTDTPEATPTLSGPTLTATNTLMPTPTPTITLTPEPPTVMAIISAGEYGGAMIRSDHSFSAGVIVSVSNGYEVEVLADTVEAESALWAHVRLGDGREGWVVRDLLSFVSPTPGW
ncbi:MAG TPA: DUF389 domain-containing protein [Longilinea sp.]|nr:DUF389 domain-containing protein [Longilinea sp.]